MHRSIWQRWLSRFLGASPAHSPVRRLRRPLLETLEGRLTPATFAPTVFTDLAISSLAAVDSLGQITDQGNAITLRSALIAANANGAASTESL